MNFIALVLALAGALVSVFYGIESLLFFQANGLAAPLLAKIAICVLGAYFFVRNIKRIRTRPAQPSGGEA